jgi:anti-sigma regulatory factor (Ser/Thr protein kinase)
VSVDAHQRVFRHKALFYADEDELLAGLTSFVRDGLAAGEPTVAVLSAPKIERLKEHLGADAGAVRFANMDEVGLDPARIIPAWRDFVSEHDGGTRLRGIGEPISAGRNPPELVECHRHEALLNLAFADVPDFWLLCPYDTAVLTPATLDGARRNHPFLCRDGSTWPRPDYASRELASEWLDDPLPEPPGEVLELAFDGGPLKYVRVLVSEYARRTGMSPARTADIVLAVHEVAMNSQRYGGGQGRVRLWDDERALTCEVRDGGRIEDPLVGRVRPRPDMPGGRGLWLANQLCDLVQIRAVPAGTVVRLHMWR